MKIKSKICLTAIILTVYGYVNAQNNAEMEETKIRNLIEKCYLNGALNDMNTEAMYEGYHSDFAIFYAEGKELKKLPLNAWVKMVDDFKKNSENNELRKFEYEFIQIDVNETTAYVKLKLLRNKTLVFTDLLTLLKFENQWKIVTKIYHSHIENPWKL
ncbi:nuclear transport factor 2 family protein [Aquimarina algicola]|uniref:Nuclear transport factor 2 family protein n=1 Tax=Aquimarina algicola TaxID=2589995 RepID=A0A504JMR6_9FLAO|nr:nuclear transport factor 2 family protein [Aquimarina algicola]TPN88001.1 nuclear transport factor 2 family protein [Aquimarina algicola]